MVKETLRKERPKSMYDNVQYSPNKPPSWQYYRCMSVVIKIFELVCTRPIEENNPWAYAFVCDTNLLDQPSLCLMFMINISISSAQISY